MADSAQLPGRSGRGSLGLRRPARGPDVSLSPADLAPARRRVVPDTASRTLTRARESGFNFIRVAVLTSVALLGLWIVTFRGFLLPDKFQFDATTIQNLAINGNADGAADDSFANVAAIYRVLGLEDKQLIAALLGYGFALLAIFFVLRTRRFAPTRVGTAALAITILFSAVYLGTYSKDVFVLPITLAVLAIGPGLKREFLLVAALVLYADIFRTYWFLVAGLYVVFRLLGTATSRRWVLLLAPVVALLVLGFVFPIAFGQPSDFARADSNQFRVGSPDATTLISDFVHLSEPWNSLVNTLLVLFTVFVPVPLLLRGGVYYLGIGACFIGIWAAFTIGLTRSSREWARSRAVSILLAFVTTQALFEPDYGSLLRHLTPLLPIVCLIATAPIRHPAKDEIRGSVRALASPE